MEKWLVQGKKLDFDEYAKEFGITPVVTRIIRNRNIVTKEEYKEYLECDLNKVESPFALKGMREGIKTIADSINRKEKIRIIGDYDIDGICSGYILTKGLKKFGADADFDVPDRITDGYGLNERLIEKAKDDNVNLIITCDNGIAAASQIKYAYELGMKVIVTDHHEVPFNVRYDGTKEYILPEAEAVIDHKQPDCMYKFKELCGAGVAYKLLKGFYQAVIKDNSVRINTIKDYSVFENEDEFFKEFLVFAAIATVGDIVDLVGENRTIVKNGLRYIKSINNPGLSALIRANELDNRPIVSYHISFIIGPCINAGGRLDTAKKAFNLFMCDDVDEAEIQAGELKALNDERKDLTLKYTEEAVKIVEESDSFKKDKVLVLYLQGCHESIAGIIAGKLKETFYKPTFVFTDSEEGLKGSGRSVEDYNMYEEMVLAEATYGKENGTNEPLMKKYGGHKMAAGLSIEKDRLNDFRRILNNSNGITDEMLVKKVWIDVAMPFECITERIIDELNILEPFGKANERPVFAEKCPEILSIKINGKNRNVVAIKMKNRSGFSMDGTIFMDGDRFINELQEKFGKSEVEAALNGRKNNIKMNVIYYPEINEFRGYRNIRVVIKNYSC